MANQDRRQGSEDKQHDLASPSVKSLLVRKLKEVKEQIGDSGSDCEVDGVVAGSTFQLPVEEEKKERDGLMVQHAIDNNHRRTKLIISQIDE